MSAAHQLGRLEANPRDQSTARILARRLGMEVRRFRLEQATVERADVLDAVRLLQEEYEP